MRISNRSESKFSKSYGIVVFLIPLILLAVCCSKGDLTKNNDGNQIINNVFPENSNRDVLNIEKTFSINSDSVPSDEGVFFSDFERDSDGSVYLLDGDSVRIYHFEKNGKLIRSFLKNGEGPGEFLGYPGLQLTKDYLWLSGGMKIGKFSKDGKFVEEYKQKSYYSAIHVVDEKRFLGTKEKFFADKNGKSQSVKILGLFSLQSEKLLFTYLETDSTGRFFVPSGKMRISVVPEGGLVPDLKFSFNRAKNEVVFADTKFSKVFTKSLTGNNNSDFTFKTEKAPVSDEFKEGIIKSFGKIQDDLRKKIFDGLPDHFCAIKKIRVLYNNSILLESQTSEGRPVFNLFDQNGELIKTFRINPGFKYHTLKYFGERIGMIEDKDESSIYHEYKITDI